MRGKAALESHEAVSLRDMIQKDQDMINRLFEVFKELKSYNDSLGQIEVVRERLRAMDLCISELQMRPSTQVLEDRLARLEDRMQDQHEEIVILQGQICRCSQQGNVLLDFLMCWKSDQRFSSAHVATCHQFVFGRRGEIGVGLC